MTVGDMEKLVLGKKCLVIDTVFVGFTFTAASGDLEDLVRGTAEFIVVGNRIERCDRDKLERDLIVIVVTSSVVAKGIGYLLKHVELVMFDIILEV